MLTCLSMDREREPVHLEELRHQAIKDLLEAQVSLQHGKTDESKAPLSDFEKAKRTLDYFTRISKLPHVNEYLETTGKSVTITSQKGPLAGLIRENEGYVIFLTHEGVKAGCYGEEGVDYRDFSGPFTTYNLQRLIETGNYRGVVTRLAGNTQDRIIAKVRKAIVSRNVA